MEVYALGAHFVRLTNLPKPVRDLPPVDYPCDDCEATTPHYAFTTDPSYFGPLILMPVSKLFPKHNHLICIRCLNITEISDETAEDIYSNTRVRNEQDDKVQEAIARFLKRLYALSQTNWSAQERREKLESAIVDYMNTFVDAANESIPTTRECPYCKETIKAGAIKCRYCSSMLQPQTTRERIPRLRKTDFAKKKVIICSSCFSDNYVGDRVCLECGAKLDYFGLDPERP